MGLRAERSNPNISHLPIPGYLNTSLASLESNQLENRSIFRFELNPYSYYRKLHIHIGRYSNTHAYFRGDDDYPSNFYPATNWKNFPDETMGIRALRCCHRTRRRVSGWCSRSIYVHILSRIRPICQLLSRDFCDSHGINSNPKIDHFWVKRNANIKRMLNWARPRNNSNYHCISRKIYQFPH